MVRTFNITDARLLEHTGITLEAMKTDLPDFSSFDPDLNEALVAALKAKYDQTLEEGGDDVARGVVGLKTQALLEATGESGKMMKSLRYWVKKAFEDDKAGLRLFQLGKYWKVRNRQAELVAYLAALSSVVADQRAKLEAVNTPADLLDSVATIAKAVEQANVVQENSKAGRKADTVDRIGRLNAIYATVLTFSNAAEFVYDEDPAKRELYRIPGNSQPSTEDEEVDAE